MYFHEIQKRAGQFAAQNASTILTAGGVIGTVLTATLTAKATFKAAELIHNDLVHRVGEAATKAEDQNIYEEVKELTTTEKVKKVWPHFVPPVVIGTATIASIVGANMMSAKRAAALAAAYGLSERQLKEYKEKVTEKLGVNKERAVRDEIAQDRVTANPPTREVIIIAGGDVLCHDMLTGRYFQSSVEDIKKAENKMNQEMYLNDSVSLSQFYDEIGLPATSMSDEVGWNLSSDDGPIEVRFTTTKTPDDRPCIAFDFTVAPKYGYNRTY